jgi:Flp pilus assembly protein TadB
MSHQHDAPVSITTARSGRSADIRRREVRYLVSMGVRTVCFVLAIVTSGPVRWVLVGAAFVLPYIAVVIANATDRRDEAQQVPFSPDRPQLNSGSPEGRGDVERR